ncbi:TPA: hypothetical protein ACIAIE_001985 [Serratia fonticola]
MRNTRTRPGISRLAGTLLALLMGLASGPTEAVMSDETGQIQGQAPTVSGDLQVLMPDGVTPVTDNATVAGSLIPDQFTLSAATAGLTPLDADGDTGLSVLVNQADGTLTWQANGTPLTPAERAVPLGNNFVGQTLELTATAPVTVSSTTGMPTTAGPIPHTTTYTVTVPVPAITGVSVNGKNFAVDSGFPSTGFIGAVFTLEVSEAASNYIWTSSAPSWAAVNNSAQVSFTQQGDSTPVTITATPNAGGDPLTYTFTVRSWFINNGNTKMNWSDASNWCTNQSLSQPTRGELTQGSGIRDIGSLWSEWGRITNYTGSGFYSGYYGTSEISDNDFNGSRHYYVNLYNGIINHYYDSSDFYIVCRQGL